MGIKKRFKGINKYKTFIILALISICCFLIFYFHFILGKGTVFTHFFYIPIILAAIWWRKKGIWVAAFLSLLLTLSHLFFREDVITINDYMRAILFVAIAGVVAVLSERIVKEQVAREKVLVELRERVKELNCLYNITPIVEDRKQLIDAVLSRIVALIPEALKFPELACAKIEYYGKQFSTYNFQMTEWFLESEITCNDRKVGSFYVCYIEKPDEEVDFFTKEEHMFFYEITERLGKIIERYNTRDELVELQKEVINISEMERLRIGHELHDGLGQMLTGISFLLRTAKKKFNEKLGEDTKELDELSKLVKDATILCRQLSKGLPAQNIKHDGLVIAIDQLSNELMEVFNVNCTIKIEGNIDIQDNFVASQLYRIIQESVNNAIRHGEADNIIISLSSDSNGLSLIVSDNGKGITNIAGKGMGMGIMKYRAGLIGGEFYAGNKDDYGFVVSVKINNISGVSPL